MKFLIYVTLCCMAFTPASAQLKVGANPTTISSGAILQADASGTRGAFYLPRVTLTGTGDVTTVVSPQAGFTLYNTATAGTAPNDVTPGYYYHDGTKWQKLLSSTGAWSLTGNNGTTPGTNFIGTTDDKDLIFKRNGGQAGWINESLLNTAFGAGSMPNTATGIYNTALGTAALGAVTTGHRNIAIGALTLGNNISGFQNTGVGSFSLSGLTTGSSNVGLGVSTGNQITTGSQNTFIGTFTGTAMTGDATNNIIIGYNQQAAALAAGNDQLNIGGAIFGTGITGSPGTPAGNIGIGTTTPITTLHVNGSFAGKVTRVTTTGTYTILATDYILHFIYSGSGTATLPAASSNTGRIIYIINHTTGSITTGTYRTANAVTATTVATGVMKGLISDGTEWFAIN